MGSLQFADLQTRPTELLDLTSLTLAEFQQLVSPFAAASKRIWPTGASMDDRAPPVGHDLHELSLADPRGSAAVYPDLPEDVSSPSGAGEAIRDGPKESPLTNSWPPGGTAGDVARPGGCSHRVRVGIGPAPGGGRG